jgi:hypothetical protein
MDYRAPSRGRGRIAAITHAIPPRNGLVCPIAVERLDSTQIAMLFGFVTSYPVNWWLIERGIKEKM